MSIFVPIPLRLCESRDTTCRLFAFVLTACLLTVCLSERAVAAESTPDEATELQTKYETALQEIKRLQNELARAEKDIDRLKEQVKEASSAPPRSWFEEGNARLNEGKYAQAVEAFTRAIAAHPRETRAYRNRGLASAKLGDYAQAIKDFDHAIALGLEEAVTYNERGIAWHQQGDSQRAIDDFTKAIGLDPKLAQAYNNRAIVHRKLGNYAPAIDDLRNASRLGLAIAPQYLQTLHDEVRQLQERLRHVGFDPGPADGIPGSQTIAALRAYQQSQGLPTTGRFDDPTRKALGVLSTTASAPPSALETLPRFVQQPKPEYPLTARQNGWEGTVTLRIETLADGTIGAVEIARSSGHAILDEAARNAVEHWTHQPMTRNGSPVTQWVQLDIHFALDKETRAEPQETSTH